MKRNYVLVFFCFWVGCSKKGDSEVKISTYGLLANHENKKVTLIGVARDGKAGLELKMDKYAVMIGSQMVSGELMPQQWPENMIGTEIRITGVLRNIANDDYLKTRGTSGQHAQQLTAPSIYLIQVDEWKPKADQESDNEVKP